MRSTRRGTPDSAARLKALTRRAYTATGGHLDLEDDAGQEFDRIVRGEEPAGTPAPGRRAVPTRRWAVSGRAVVVVLAVIAALAGAVVARAIALGPTDPVPVPLLEASETVSGPDGPVPAPQDEPGGEPQDDPGTAAGTATGTAVGTAEPGTGRQDGAHSSASVPDQAETSAVLVHVAGAVAQPGVVELPPGARVAAAVEAAGGPLADAELAAVNLARPVQDGEQVYVPRTGEAVPGTAAGPPGPGPGSSAGPAGAGSDGAGGAALVDLNAADLAALETLPGVGPAIAQRVLQWRDAHGPFRSVDELLEVSGIGPATFERLRERVRV